MFFKHFGTIHYTIDGKTKKAQNILKAVLPKFNKITDTFLFQKYLVNSGERPESVAFELYNEATYYWVLIVINNIVNPYTDWPMSDEEVELYTIRKYGKDNIYNIHHFYRLSTGKWLDEVDEAIERGKYPNNAKDIMPVTNLQYEIDKNQERRHIIVINPRFINKFIELYNEELLDGDE